MDSWIVAKMQHDGAEPFLSVDWIPTEIQDYNQCYQSVHLLLLAQDEAFLSQFGKVALIY